MKARLLIAAALVFVVSSAAIGQKLPDKIRGYKVHNADVSVAAADPKERSSSSDDALITLGKPQVLDLGISGITLGVGADIAPTGQSGEVDFLTFRDFRVNGIAVEIEEYEHAFKFKKGETISLPKPAKVFIGTLNMARAVRREVLESKKHWRVTGTVLVFGKFKKFGFSFKRVIPVKIELDIPNPLGPLK